MTAGPIDIAAAVAADGEDVARLAAALLAELSGAGPPDPEQYIPSTQDMLAAETVWAFPARPETGAATGLLTLYEAATIYARGRFGVIAELYVVPEMRSAGIAKAMVERAMVFGKAKGWNRLEVTAPARPRWDRTINFYLANDFVEGGLRLQRYIL